jgi:hypothetical protein
MLPGTTGTPAFSMLARARVFSPIASIADAGGPMKTMPAASQARTNAAFSLRKAVAGWMASAPEDLAASRMRSKER